MRTSRRRSRSWALASAATVGTLLLTSVLTARTPARRPPACVGSLIPAYLQPHAIVDLVDSAPGPRLLVVNPANGPGEQDSPDYARAIKRAQASGAHVLGYVASTYGAREATAVETDVARYREWYGVDGIFLDEVADGEAQLAYYSALSRRIRDAASLLVFNPGMVPARDYFALADVVVTYEGPIADYAARLEAMPGWLDDVPATQVAHLVYGASREQARAVLELPRRSAYLYVTSGTLPNPWGTPPPYLREEQAAMTVNDRRSPICP